MSSIVNPLTARSVAGTGTGSTTTTTPPDPGDPLASESTFLTLLVSQLQNQDPLNPTDSNTFVSQLTSYSQLEQLIDINKNTTAATGATTGTTGTTTTNTGS
jgi:flagellar basal-body rod modification protein FlgD